MLGRSRVRRNSAAADYETERGWVSAMTSSHIDHLSMLEFRWLSGTHQVGRERTLCGGSVGLVDVFFETYHHDFYESTKGLAIFSAEPSHPCRIH
jgi:hypothetical protein